MGLDVDKLKDISEAVDWLRCPSCGSYDCRIGQDPGYIYFFCEECDMYTDFGVSRWS